MDGQLWLVCGSSRSGKTVFVSESIKSFNRVFVWDVEAQYSGTGWIRCRTKKDLMAAIKKAGRGPAKIAYTGRLTDFGFWADCAFLWGRLASCAVVAEETSDVTSPGKAPEQWGVLLRRGLKYGISIFAITQRPSESDKTAVGNATNVHLCRMTRSKDRKYMADELDISASDIGRLVDDSGGLRCIQRDMKTGEITTGTLTFPRKKPKFSFNSGLFSA